MFVFGIVGPIFLIVYFALIALALTSSGAKSIGKKESK